MAAGEPPSPNLPSLCHWHVPLTLKGRTIASSVRSAANGAEQRSAGMMSENKSVEPREWSQHSYYYQLGSLFNPTESRQILSVTASLEPHEGALTSASGARIREATLFWLPRDLGSSWLFNRLSERVKMWNQDFDIEIEDGGPSHCQITRYKAGQKYDWHMDLGRGRTSRRKISLVVGLNDNADFEGGGLEFFFGSQANPIVRPNVGEGVLFPSYVMHRAVEVTRGVRWTLVVWFNGRAPFR